MDLLKDAREGAGLSQRELARRAGTSQAMVARIERGQQSPSISTLERLVRACGRELRIEAAGADQAAVERRPASGDTRLFVWRAGGAAYAVPLTAVERITELRALHRLPGQAPGAGVVIVDGEAVAAIDAASRLGITEAARDHVVVVATGAGRRAVIVDRAETVAAETRVVPPPDGSGASEFVTGLAEIEGEHVVVLDPDGFCAS
jgi:transcriptional regulator with XRE-family HTH domain